MPHRGTAPGKAMLSHQAIINPPGGMALLPGPVFVLHQPLIDQGEIGPQHRIRLLHPGSITTGLTPEDLSHRLPGVAGFPTDLLDALLIDPMRGANIPILIHPDHPLHL